MYRELRFYIHVLADMQRDPASSERTGSKAGKQEIGGQGRNRTIDTRIFSPLLYQLSYLAILGYLAWPPEVSLKEHPTGRAL